MKNLYAKLPSIGATLLVSTTIYYWTMFYAACRLVFELDHVPFLSILEYIVIILMVIPFLLELHSIITIVPVSLYAIDKIYNLIDASEFSYAKLFEVLAAIAFLGVVIINCKQNLTVASKYNKHIWFVPAILQMAASVSNWLDTTPNALPIILDILFTIGMLLICLWLKNITTSTALHSANACTVTEAVSNISHIENIGGEKFEE